MAYNISDDKKIDNLNENSDIEDAEHTEEKNELSNTEKKENKSSKSKAVSTKSKKVSSYKKKICNLKAAIQLSPSAVFWDPLISNDWDAAGAPGHLASTRIKRDLSSLFKEPLPGIFAIPDETNLCLVHCLVLGPFETPYEGGFFHFAVRFGPSYPIHPPRVRLMTTDGGKVRFNPNLYANGKVCLSILGTWSGPVWSPALNLGSLLLSIQSLLNEKPYFNEPGFKTEHFAGESNTYNILITHETIRVAVCGQLEHILNSRNKPQQLPQELANVIKDSFLDFYDGYVEICNRYKHLDDHKMTDIFFSIKKHSYHFSWLLERLKKLKERLTSAALAEEKESITEPDSSLSSISDEDLTQEDSAQTQKYVMEEANEFLAEDDAESGAEAKGSASPSAVETYTIDDDLQLFMDDEEEGSDEE